MVPNKRVWSLQVFLVQSASCQTSDTLSENMFQKWNSELVGKESFSQIQEKYLRAQEKALCFLSPNKSSGRCVHTSCGPIRNLSICFPRGQGPGLRRVLSCSPFPSPSAPFSPCFFSGGLTQHRSGPTVGTRAQRSHKHLGWGGGHVCGRGGPAPSANSAESQSQAKCVWQ